MKIEISGKDRTVNALAKQAHRSKGVKVEIIEGIKPKQAAKKAITVDEIKDFLTENEIKFHSRLGENKLRVLYAESLEKLKEE